MISTQYWGYWLSVYRNYTELFFCFIWHSCLCNRGFQDCFKVRAGFSWQLYAYYVHFYINCTFLPPLLMISPFPFAVPTYLSITTWSSMMWTAYTHTLLRQNGRFVPQLHRPFHVYYRDQGAFWMKYVCVHCCCRKTVQPAVKYLWTCTLLLLPNSRKCSSTSLRALPCKFV